MIINRVFISLVLMTTLAGCSLFPDADREAYKKSKRVKPLEEPPEIVLPKRDASFDIPDTEKGTISKKSNEQEVEPDDKKTSQSSLSIVPQSSDVQMQRDGSLRWLSVKLAPEALWQPLLAFWKDNQTKIIESDAKLGTIKTDWIVSEAGLVKKKSKNNIFVSGSNGDLVLRDQFRMRLERTETGSNVFISHIGSEKIKDSDGSEHWELRPSRPELEAEVLTKLQQYLSQS